MKSIASIWVWGLCGLLALSCQRQDFSLPLAEDLAKGDPRLAAFPEPGSVQFSWGRITWGNPPSGRMEELNPESYVLELSSLGLEELKPFITLSGDQTQFRLDVEDGGGIYYARLKVCFPDGDTMYSNPISVGIPPQRVIPQAMLPLDGQSRFWGAWSPDATQLCYARSESSVGEGYGIYTYELTQGVEQFIRGGQQPDWSPTGGQIAGVTDLSFNRNHPDSSTFLALLTPGSSHVVAGGGAHLRHPSWSPTGRWIAFLRYDLISMNSEVRILSVGGNFDQTALGLNLSELDDLPAATDRWLSHLTWHPMDKKLVYDRQVLKQAWPSGFSRDILSFDMSNQQEKELISSPWNDFQPSYSPTGNYLAFISDRSGIPGIWLWDELDQHLYQWYGGTDRLIDVQNGKLSWSPDGEKLLFNAWVDDSTTTLFTVDAPL